MLIFLKCCAIWGKVKGRSLQGNRLGSSPGLALVARLVTLGKVLKHFLISLFFICIMGMWLELFWGFNEIIYAENFAKYLAYVEHSLWETLSRLGRNLESERRIGVGQMLLQSQFKINSQHARLNLIHPTLWQWIPSPGHRRPPTPHCLDSPSWAPYIWEHPLCQYHAVTLRINEETRTCSKALSAIYTSFIF